MKKIITLFLIAFLSLGLTACGDSGSSSNELTLNTPNSVENYADFELVKIQTTDTVRASLGNSGGYTSFVDGNVYVDIILDYTNTSTESLSCDEAITIKAKGASGTEYEDFLYAVETDNLTSIETYANLIPQSTARLHCAIAVPQTETEVNVTLNVNGSAYTCNYKLSDTISNITPINVGETIEIEDFAKMTFKGVSYTDDVLPSMAGNGGYTHYQIDNSSNTYLVAQFDITNYQSSQRDAETFLSTKAKFMEKYNYTGYVVVEDEDGKGFSSWEDIDPLTTRSFYCLIEIPKTVAESDLELTINFGGQEYIYNN